MLPPFWRPRARLGPACPGCLGSAPQIRSHLNGLYQRTFYFHFENLLYANGRNNTFLCYEVTIARSAVPSYRGIFTKQDHFQKCLHAELCFLYWFHEHMSSAKRYQITWYVSWSPCADCARQVAEFLATHPNVTLTIFTARLYYFWEPRYQEGLYRLYQEGASVAPMSYKEFEYCWENFVYSQGKSSFRPWRKLNINFRLQTSRLEKILGFPRKEAQRGAYVATHFLTFSVSTQAQVARPGGSCSQRR